MGHRYKYEYLLLPKARLWAAETQQCYNETIYLWWSSYYLYGWWKNNRSEMKMLRYTTYDYSMTTWYQVVERRVWAPNTLDGDMTKGFKHRYRLHCEEEQAVEEKLTCTRTDFYIGSKRRTDMHLRTCQSPGPKSLTEKTETYQGEDARGLLISYGVYNYITYKDPYRRHTPTLGPYYVKYRSCITSEQQYQLPTTSPYRVIQDWRLAIRQAKDCRPTWYQRGWWPGTATVSIKMMNGKSIIDDVCLPRQMTTDSLRTIQVHLIYSIEEKRKRKGWVARYQTCNIVQVITYYLGLLGHSMYGTMYLVQCEKK